GGRSIECPEEGEGGNVQGVEREQPQQEQPQQEHEQQPQQEQEQEQQQQRNALDEDTSCAASALPSSPAAASTPESRTEQQAAAPTTSGEAATKGGDGDAADADFMAKPEASFAPIMVVNSPVPVHGSVGDGASSDAVEIASAALFSALESDDDDGGGHSSPENAQEGVGKSGGSSEQRAYDGGVGVGLGERTTAMEGEGEAGEGRVGEEEAARRCAGDERESVRVLGRVEEERAAAGAVCRREPDGGERNRPYPAPSRQDSQADGGRSARRLPEPGGAVAASRGSEIVPVALFPAAADAVEEKGEEGEGEEEEEIERNSVEGRISRGAKDLAKQEKESGPSLVPSAEALTQKFLEVTLLWGPILRNSGSPSGGGCWTGADASNSKESRPLLPETEALRAKAKVVSAWFDLRARPVAMDIAADAPETTKHDAEEVQSSAPPAGHDVRSGATAGGGTTAVARGLASGRAGADGGESKSRASTRRSQERAACGAAPRSRSVAPISAGAPRASESGAGTQRAPRAGKGHRGSLLRRLSVSPPRTK
ncbi:unnamed protein product, partial [Scytosiphon promiscuus]